MDIKIRSDCFIPRHDMAEGHIVFTLSVCACACLYVCV